MNISNGAKKQAGFTLIELLVVISIIGLLSTLAIVALNNARMKSRDAKRIGDIQQIQTALELYYNDENGYPATAVVTKGNKIQNSGGSIIYMSAVPANPGPKTDNGCPDAEYTYAAIGSGVYTSYTLTFCLGAKTGVIEAGIHTASPAGVKD